MERKGLNWDEITFLYAEMAFSLRSFRLLGDASYETYRFHRLTYGLVPAPDWIPMGDGNAVYIRARRVAIDREAWISLAYEVGAEIDPSLRLHSHLQRRATVDHFRVIETAVQKGQISHAFLNSWARLHTLYARFQMRSLNTEVWDDEIEQTLQGALHWYAFLLRENAPSFAAKDRVDASQSLGMLCDDIKNGRLTPWGPYPADWYGRCWTTSRVLR
jgi:hypothetical protein